MKDWRQSQYPIQPDEQTGAGDLKWPLLITVCVIGLVAGVVGFIVTWF